MTKRLVDPRSGSVVVVDDELAKRLGSNFINESDFDGPATINNQQDDTLLIQAQTDAAEANEKLDEANAEIEELKAALAEAQAKPEGADGAAQDAPAGKKAPAPKK